MRDRKEAKLRAFGGILSLVMGLTIMGLKFYAYKVSGSKAIFSDALESVVNVVAAGFTLWAIRAAEAPPDAGHPYGHGKLEFVTAVFEGGLITFAAFMIAYEAVTALLAGPVAPVLELGIPLIAGAGVLNGILGIALLWIGRKGSSMALEADGKHVLSDFYSSIGVILGLFVVKWTGMAVLDPLIALLLAGVLAYTGVPIVRRAIDGLIDAADEELLDKVNDALERNRFPGIIRLHFVRAMRNGRRIHIDGHVVVPEFWSVDEAHHRLESFESAVLNNGLPDTEFELHTDPCGRLYCRACEYEPCPVRQASFIARPPLSVTELTAPVDIVNPRKP